MADQFTLRKIVRIYVAALVLLIAGTIGFRLLVEHSWLNSMYRTVVTATLNGLDSPPRSTGGKVWTVIVVLGGVTIFAYVGAAVVEVEPHERDGTAVDVHRDDGRVLAAHRERGDVGCGAAMARRDLGDGVHHGTPQLLGVLFHRVVVAEGGQRS